MNITQTQTWNVPDDLMNDLACSIITTAIEGGINYWASVDQYRWGAPDLGHSHDQANGTDAWQDGDRTYAHAKVHDDEDNVWYYVDAAKMTEALVKIVSGDLKPFYNAGYNETFRERLVSVFNQAEKDPKIKFLRLDFDFDADDADAAMQIALLGEVVYG